MTNPITRSFPDSIHDHDVCLARALDRAIERCVERGIKWTDLREIVFVHLARSHKPVSAYDLIEMIALSGKRLSPVSIYRILDLLREAGLVHRLESRNAYFACLTDHPSGMSTVVFHCDDCNRVAEKDATDAMTGIFNTVKREGFQPRSTIVEISGICNECATAQAAGQPC